MKKEYFVSITIFWIALVALLIVCSYYMVHNAAWLFGDEAIVYSTTGMGKAFSPFGFECMIDCFGRFYPFAYNLYNVLLLFDSGQISPEMHYVLHAIALIIFTICFVFTALQLLKTYSPAIKYSIAFCFATIALFRVFPEFVTCYTGAWIVFLLLSVFVLCTCKFEESEHWGWGIPAVLSITYICYCYENICVIPITYGTCTLLFNHKNISSKKRLFNGLLVASGVLFLVLYAVIVLPRANNFYSHHSEITIVQNALKIFIAQKIYWIALIFLLVRLWDVLKNKKSYIFADSFLLTAFAYFCGTAFLHLDFVYYYNFGALIALTSILCYCKEYFKPYLVLVLMLSLSAFYGRKMPSNIKVNQESRIYASTQITKLTEYVEDGYDIYWYAPKYGNVLDMNVEFRNWRRDGVLRYLEWCTQECINFIDEETFDSTKKGIWLNPYQNTIVLPETDTIFINYPLIYRAGAVSGYLIE